MIGNRANISAYAEIPKGAVVKKTPLEYKITPAQRSIDKLEAIREDLEDEFSGGLRSFEEYVELSNALDIRLQRAWRNLEKQLGKPAVPVVYEGPVFSLFKAGIQAIPEAVCKGSAKEVENSFYQEAKYFLTASIAGAMILISLANL